MRSVKIPLSVGAIALALLILILALQGTATARPPASVAASFIPTEPDFPIWEWHGTNACNEMHADVAYNWSEDEYLVVFDWDLNGTGDHDIMAITVSADGQPSPTGPFSVAAGTTYDDSYPAVTRNPIEDSYLVVWQRRVGTGDCDIYGSVISDTVGAPLPIATYSNDQLYPDIAYATGSRHYLVVWQDNDSLLASPPDVRGRCVDENGAPMGLLFFIGTGSGDQTSPSLATNACDYRWLVAWRDTRDGEANIYGREVNSLGNCSLPSSVFAINGQAGWAGMPAVGWGQVDPSVSWYGEFLVAWPEENNVFAQRVDGQYYSLVEAPITVSDYDSSKGNPDVVFATEPKEWWVVWQDDRDYG